MTLPKQPEIELPLLEALVQVGGEAKAKKLYSVVRAQFPEITDADMTAKLSSGNPVWENRVQWARQHLVDSGDMESGGWGVWRITEKGRQRVKDELKSGTTPLATDARTLQEIWDEYEAAFRRKALERLLSLTPTQFEQFGRDFLRAYGFEEVEVTAVGPDGGIDGFGKLRVGLATMSVAFQCKRWQGNVPRPEIDKFRGATQGSYEQGIFFTTADFTKGALDASIKRGAIPIILVNGEAIVDVMIAKGLGVTKRPIYLFEDVPIAGVDGEEESG